MNPKRVIVIVLTALMLVAAVSVVTAQGQSELAQVRAATAQFHRVEVAEAAGYLPVSPCVSHPVLGGMGFHYGNGSLIDTELDPLQPEILLYEPTSNGRLRLVGVEYVVPIAAWDALYDEPPTLFGQRLHRNEFLGMYALHVWIWKHNPAGMFADFNPNVTCNP